jgi:hypothetical protein
MMPLFPSPSLKFRTAGFPQYGFKADISGGAFPSTTRFASALRAVRSVRPCSSSVSGGLSLRSAVMRTLRPTPVALAPVRVIVSRSIYT